MTIVDPPARNSGCLTVLLVVAVVAVLLYVCSPGPEPGRGVDDVSGRAGPPPVEPEGARWKLLGKQGDMHFVVVDVEGDDKTQYFLASNRLCRDKTHCYVTFWTNEALAGRSLPLSASAVSAQVAGYRMNRNTGLSQWGWRCDKWPNTPPEECF